MGSTHGVTDARSISTFFADPVDRKLLACEDQALRRHRRGNQSRRFCASQPLASLQPLPLPRSRLEVLCNRSRVLSTSNHRASHFVSVSVQRSLQEQRSAVESPRLAPAHAIPKLVQRDFLVPPPFRHAWNRQFSLTAVHQFDRHHRLALSRGRARNALFFIRRVVPNSSRTW